MILHDHSCLSLPLINPPCTCLSSWPASLPGLPLPVPVSLFTCLSLYLPLSLPASLPGLPLSLHYILVDPSFLPLFFLLLLFLFLSILCVYSCFLHSFFTLRFFSRTHALIHSLPSFLSLSSLTFIACTRLSLYQSFSHTYNLFFSSPLFFLLLKSYPPFLFPYHLTLLRSRLPLPPSTHTHLLACLTRPSLGCTVSQVNTSRKRSDTSRL